MNEFEYDLVEKALNNLFDVTAAAGNDTFYERFGFEKSLGMTKYIER